MRVISGRAKGRKLKIVPGNSTRPIPEKVKASLFNVLGDFVPGSRWLDLFAGTGQVGIEALSRDASQVVFIDTAQAAIRVIHDNLRHTGLEAGAKVMRMDALAYLRHPPAEKFDLIFVAPPQYKGIWLEVMQIIDTRPREYLNEGGLVVVQIDPREYEPLPLTGLLLTDQRRYGDAMLCYYDLNA
ncbi:MAG: 16S rRNA (guanine(966)-N(2))-methyltransferase RsmD [Anaerolineae bacterium]|nr:16S rRNA (guanine(966)-N(2))-methyltransferase RsmD [Anaerolineae bacterium]